MTRSNVFVCLLLMFILALVVVNINVVKAEIVNAPNVKQTGILEEKLVFPSGPHKTYVYAMFDKNVVKSGEIANLTIIIGGIINSNCSNFSCILNAPIFKNKVGLMKPVPNIILLSLPNNTNIRAKPINNSTKMYARVWVGLLAGGFKYVPISEVANLSDLIDTLDILHIATKIPEVGLLGFLALPPKVLPTILTYLYGQHLGLGHLPQGKAFDKNNNRVKVYPYVFDVGDFGVAGFKIIIPIKFEGAGEAKVNLYVRYAFANKDQYVLNTVGAQFPPFIVKVLGSSKGNPVPQPTPTPTPTPTPISDLNRGLVAYYSFDHIKNHEVIDDSGHGFNAIIHGHPRIVKGVKGYALEFNGKTDYLTTPRMFDDKTLKAITITAWFKLYSKPTSIATSKQIIEAHTGYDPYKPWRYEIHIETEVNPPSTKMRFWITDINGKGHKVVTPFEIPLNEWHHIACVYDGKHQKIYIDGRLVAEKNWTGKFKIVTGFTIGRDYEWNAQYFHGVLDEIRIYDRALSDKEIKMLANIYHPTSTPVPTPKPPTSGNKVVILSEDFNTTRTRVIAKAPAKGFINLNSGVWGYVLSGSYSGPCSVGGPPEWILAKSVELSNGQKSHGGALVGGGGKEYYCDGWRRGGPAYVYHDLELPKAKKIILEVRFGKPGWSNYEHKPTDAYAIIKIVNLDTGKEEVLFDKLIGGDYGCGWFTKKFDITRYGGHKVRIILEGMAGGHVKLGPYCTGTWDSEAIAFDWVKIIAYGKSIPTPTPTPTPTAPASITLKPSTTTVSPGNTFTLDVYLTANNVQGAKVCINYPSTLTYVSYKAYNAFPIEFSTPGNGTFIYTGISPTTLNLSNTKVLTLTFKANKVGTAVITGNVTFKTATGSFTIPAKPATITVVKEPWQMYDVNKDGKIEMKELMMAINDWFDNKITTKELMEVINVWFES